MRNVHRELNSTPDRYVFNIGCPISMYQKLVALSLSRLEQILAGSEDFVSEEAWLMRNDINSLINTLTAVTGAYPSQITFQGGKDYELIEEKYIDV